MTDESQGLREMKERPILFNAEMVRAVLDGPKTETRRVMRPKPEFAYPGTASLHLELNPFGYAALAGTPGAAVAEPDHWSWVAYDARGNPCGVAPYEQYKSPYGVPGDRLWVRETWGVDDLYDYTKPSEMMAEGFDLGDPIWYRSTAKYPIEKMMSREGRIQCGRWRSPIHMPRWASRITLEVKDVRVEQLQDISYEDVLLEGIPHEDVSVMGIPGAVIQFAALWDSINAKRGYSWESNPWVWAVKFKLVTS